MLRAVIFSLAATAAVGGRAVAQGPEPLGQPLKVGDPAPDFTLSGATKDGLTGPVSLHAYRGKTVVLAFFFKARTKG